MKKANKWLALLLFGALCFVTPSLNAQQNEPTRTETTTAGDDGDDDSGKWGLLGLVGLLGLLGLKKKDDNDRHRTTTTNR